MATFIRNLLLGFADEKIQHETRSNWNINKVGGLPDQFSTADVGQIHVLRVRCQICGQLLAMVVQLYCPLAISNCHRVLYIFCCVNESCWNKPESWQVVRSQRLATESCKLEKEMQTSTQSPSSWLMEEDVWDEDGCELDSDDLTCKALVDMTIHGSQDISEDQSSCVSQCPKENSVVVALSPPKASSFPLIANKSRMVQFSENEQPIFSSYYINVFEEDVQEKDVPSEHIQSLMENYYLKDGNPFYKMNNPEENTLKSEGYEQTDVKHGDKTFYKFIKCISQHPKQIIRYNWQGQPLHMTNQGPSPTQPPSCQYCGSRRVFELQLMPMLIHCLKLHNFPACDTPVEFGTVIVNTCERSCWTENDFFKSEHISIQVDPTEKLLHRTSLNSGM